MINKKNVLGKTPSEIGIKDAIHTAIVSVRAGSLIRPGDKCKINQYNEAVACNSNSIGVADPWHNGNIIAGNIFWLIINQDEIPNVRHVWDHPSVSFEQPTREVQYNYTLKHLSDQLEIEYNQLLKDMEVVAKTDTPIKYTGNKTEEELETIQEDSWDYWSEFADVTGYVFENYGSQCCPEYNYPECGIYRKVN